MKQLLLNIEESKIKEFFNLLKTLDYVSVYDDTESYNYQYKIPQWQQDIVNDRIRNSNPEEMIPWEKAREKLRFKNK